ncbi:MAG: 16S rRNA (guanine(527)-N(7))-methyltransferase RsmG [Betaproteobacteria bacterium]|nr:MAG: 16S rRNA (guanine(527)-N(7))-methyltransferase RsmG [Betaproteobacteria bacterium]
MNDILAAGARALGVDLDRDAPSRLMAYLSLLRKWNRTHNLTAIVEPEKMITRHLLDSLSVVPHLPVKPKLRVADVGSGGGLPGIPLAICRPDWRLTLIDSNLKKAAFLCQAVIELALANVEVVCARSESYRPPLAFEVAISRAYSSLRNFVLQGRHLVAPAGRLFAMKAAYPKDEIDSLPSGIRMFDAVRLHVPGIEAERCLIIMESVDA